MENNSTHDFESIKIEYSKAILNGLKKNPDLGLYIVEIMQIKYDDLIKKIANYKETNIEFYDQILDIAMNPEKYNNQTKQKR